MARPLREPDVDISLGITSLLHGAHNQGALRTREQAVMCSLTAAISFAIDTGGAGGEQDSIDLVQEVLDELKQSYGKAVTNGIVNGRSTCGYDRR